MQKYTGHYGEYFEKHKNHFHDKYLFCCYCGYINSNPCIRIIFFDVSKKNTDALKTEILEKRHSI